MSLKRGKYSKGEEKYVTDNVHTMTVAQIASALNRNTDSVENFIKKRKLKTIATQEDEDEVTRLVGVLHSSSHWQKILIALTEREIKLFESDWVHIIKQFGEDVWFTEEMYIVDWLLLNIKKYRTYKLEKDSLQAIEDIEKLLEMEYKLDPELRDIAAISKYEQELAIQKSAITQHTNALKVVLEKIEKIAEKLKANREERRDIKANDGTYWGYIQMLDDEKYRRRESRQAELMRIAQNAAREKLYDYHTYMDNELDIPLLTPEIVERNLKENKYERKTDSDDIISKESVGLNDESTEE